MISAEIWLLLSHVLNTNMRVYFIHAKSEENSGIKDGAGRQAGKRAWCPESGHTGKTEDQVNCQAY